MRPASQALTALLAVVAVTGGGLTTSVAAASGSSPRPAVEGAPSPPLNVQAAVDAGTTVTDGAVVSWTPPASPGVGDVTSYAVIPFDETSGATLAPSDVNGAPPATTATVSGVLAGDSYTFTVTAANFVGSSDASAPSNAVVPVGVAASQSDSATSSTPSGSATASLAMPGASSSITGTATGGEGTLTVATYPSPPIASTSIDGAFYDVRLSVAAGFTQLVLVFCGVQLPGSVRFWNPATRNYVPIPNQSAPTSPGRCVTVTLGAGSVPALADLTGSVFVVPTSPAGGYDLAGADGGVFAFGDAAYVGSLPGMALAVHDIVGLAATPDGRGYWLVGADGGVFAFGDARFHGSLAGTSLRGAAVGIVATPDGGGYWVVGADGGVFAFGDAAYVGSLPGMALAVRDIVGLAATPDGRGYWLVGGNGGVFAFGDARFHGSLAGTSLRGAAVGIAASPDGGGYRVVGADGGVFAFGDAGYAGSLPGKAVALHDIVGLAGTPDGGGYWLVGADGGVFAFGDAPFRGSLGGVSLRGAVAGGAPA